MTSTLSAAAGLELEAYRAEHVAERIRRALERENLSAPAELVRLLRVDTAARIRFRRSVAISVSGLFRDPHQFALLERELLPPLLAKPGRIGVWSAGCADGSELYSVATLLDRAGALDRSLLLGSDVLEENLERARAGTYDGATMPVRLRERARWEQRDLLTSDPPAGCWRLIVCRNVAIYFRAEQRLELHERLTRALDPGGILLLGRSERLADPASLGMVRAGPHAYRRLP